MMKKTIVTALAVVGAWCARAGTSIAELYIGDATTPTIVESVDGNSDGQILQTTISQVSSRGRFVLLKSVTLGEQSDVILGYNEGGVSSVTIDLNGKSLAVNGSWIKSSSDAKRLVSICNLTFADSVGGGTISGYPLMCARGCSITFNLPNASVVSADTGYLDYDPHDKGADAKGAVTINGGKFDGCVGGSNSYGTTLLTNGLFNKTKNATISSYDATQTRYFDNGDGYWRVLPIDCQLSTITVPTVAHATAKVYTNGVEVAGAGGSYEVALGATVKVAYAAEADYVFAGGGTTHETTFVANNETIVVSDIPDEPIPLSGVTVNGLDVSALYGTGWKVAEGLFGGFYTVTLTSAREYVLSGANTNGYVRFDVVASGASLVVSNLTLSGYGEYTRSGIYLDNCVAVDLTLKGLNVIAGGAYRPAIEVQEDASLSIGGDGSLAASHGESADYIGRYQPHTAGAISYSGGRYNFEVPESQVATGYVRKAISETEGGYTFAWRVAKGTVGISVNGEDVFAKSGDGWTFADGVLSLTNAQAYVLSGTNTAGAVRVEVTADAAVTLDNFELVCDAATVDLIRFGDNVTATLTLSGVNTVYTANDYAAVQVAEGAALTVNGDGELVGGKSGSHCGRGVCVYYYGTLNWNGGTLRDYYFFKSGSTQEKGAGVYTMAGSVFNLRGGRLTGMRGYDGGAIFTQDGTVNVYGGDIAGNTAFYGSAIYCRGTVNVYGGNVTNNTVTDAGIVCAGSGTISIYGGIVSGNSGKCYHWDYGDGYLYGAAGADLANCVPAVGRTVVQLADGLYVVGENVTSADGKLTGGTFTFNPTNAEYAAVGVALAPNRTVEKRGKTDYAVVVVPKGVTVGGIDVAVGAGDGWTFADGVLSLTNAQAYVLSGTNTAGAVRVEVTADAAVTLDNLKLQNGVDTPLVSHCHDVTILLRGTNEITSTAANRAAIACLEGSTTFDRADGETDASARLTAVGASYGAGIGCGKWQWGGPIVINGGTIEAQGGDCAAGIGSGYGCAGTQPVTINGGIVRAHGGTSAAGIGEGAYCYDGAVTISGGYVAAVGGSYSYSDIGVGNHAGELSGHACAIAISGGTVVAARIGDADGSSEYTKRVALTGGSFNGAACPISLTPTNAAGAVVYRVTVPGEWASGTPVAVTGLPADYGTTGIVAVNGQINLWLPNGSYGFATDGTAWQATVKDANTTATLQPTVSTVVPQTVAHTTVKVYTNDVEVAGQGGAYPVAFGATVKVVYTADAGYVFAGGGTTATAVFTADAEEVTVPDDQVPAAPCAMSVRVTQASGEVVYAESFTNAMNVATNGATVTLLEDRLDERIKTVYMGKSFTLEGDGHALGFETSGGLPLFGVLSNDTVRLSGVAFDGLDTTGMLAFVSSGSLTVTNCCVTGFVTPGGSVLVAYDGAVDVTDCVFCGNDAGLGAIMTFLSTTDAPEGGYLVDRVTVTNNVCGAAVRSSNASGEPARHWFASATIGDNCGTPALVTYDGVSVVGANFIGDNGVVIDRQSAIAFAPSAPDTLDVFVQSAVNREGDILVTNLYGVAFAASQVRLSNAGYAAWGENGNVYLLSDARFLYGVSDDSKSGADAWSVYRSFGEAYAQSTLQPAPATVSLVHYRNAATGEDIATQGDSLTVGAGTNLVLRTVLRETLDGTNTTWSGATTNVVTLTGTLTVAGTLKLENVAVAGKVVLAGGTLDIGAGYVTNGVPVTVEFQTSPGSTEVAAITSDVYTGAELLPHFSLKSDNLVFVIRDNGLSVVKVDDKVAQVENVNYDTFSEAVTAVADGGLVKIIAASNATDAAHRDEVKFGSDVQVADGKRFLVKSIRTTLFENAAAVVDEYPAVPVTMLLDGGKVTLGEGATMAFTNVAMQGTLALAGSGLIDLRHFTGELLVRPTRTGLIATNVTDAAQLRLGTGATGVLYAKGTGVWWRDGAFTATFTQTGNGIGRIDIDDYGVKRSVEVSEPVKNGQCDYYYEETSGQTGTRTNLHFGVVWCEVGTKDASGSKITLPPKSLYAAGEQYPQYLTANSGYASFDLNADGTWKTLPDLPVGEKDPDTHLSQTALYIRNYGAKDVVIATYNVVATENDAKTGLTEAYNNPDDELRETFRLIEDVSSDIAKMGVNILFFGGVLTANFVGYNVVSWIDAVKGLISSVYRLCCDVYVNEGANNADYYTKSHFDDAVDTAVWHGYSVHVMRSTKYEPYVITRDEGSLAIDAAACQNTEFSGLASCIIGVVVPTDPFSASVISWLSGIGLEFVEDFVEGQINERVPHGMMSNDGGKALLTIPKGFTVTLTGMDASGLSDKDLASPVFDVSGTLKLETAEGLGKPNNRLSGYKSVSSAYGVVHVRSSGRVYLCDTVTANAGNAKNFYVEKGGLVFVEYAGKDSRVGISGQTGDGDVFGQPRWSGATVEDCAKIFSNDAKPANCTLAMNADDYLYWSITPTVVYLDLKNLPHYATYDAAAADCAKAYVTRPNDAVKNVIGADAYNKLFGVSVVNDGTASTPWTLQVDLTTSVSNAVQTAIDAALPSLVSTITNEVPAASVTTQAGLYYGIPASAAVGNIGAAAVPVWTLGTGAVGQEVKGAKPAGATDKAFYRLRVVILP